MCGNVVAVENKSSLNHQGIRACNHILMPRVTLGGLIEPLLQYFLKVNSVFKVQIMLVMRRLNM